MNTLFPLTRQQFFNNTGAPLAYGYVYTYAAGTVIPQASYNASGGVNTNPIQLDFRGQCDLWGPSNVGYKVLVTDSSGVNVPGYPVDNIVVGPTTSGSFIASAGGFTSAPTPTVNWSISGLQATVVVGNFSGTSSSTAFSLSGIPSVLQPPTNSQIVALPWATNNSATVNSGISVLINSSLSAWTFLLNGSSSGWTASGTKGFPNAGNIAFSYLVL